MMQFLMWQNKVMWEKRIDMISVDLRMDEELTKVVNLMISAMLPHENYDPDCFLASLDYALSYIKLDEFKMEYRVILSALSELGKIKVHSLEYKPKLTREIFENIITVSIEDLITDNTLGIIEYLTFEGLNNNLTIQTTKELAMQKLYTLSIELYDVCFKLAQDSNTVANYIPEYKAAFIGHTAMEGIKAQSNILMGSLSVGRRVYSGNADWLEYTQTMASEINTRISAVEEDNSLTVVDSLAKANEMLKDLQTAFIPIANWGIPELDGNGISAGTPILRHRLVVAVGAVNVGKTMFSIDAAVNVVLAGNKIVYMVGEGVKAGVWGNLLINYINKKWGKFVTLPMLSDIEAQPEAIAKIIKIAIAELFDSKSISLREAYDYDTFYQQAMKDYNDNPYDMLIIDHSLALNSARRMDDIEKVTLLAVQARTLKKKIPVCILVTSHPSSQAKEYLVRSKMVPGDIDPTAGSRRLNAEADEVLILNTNETLRKQGMVMMQNSKRRNAPVLRDFIYLNTMFDACRYIYDPSKQTVNEKDNTTAEQAIQELEELYGEDDSSELYTL